MIPFIQPFFERHARRVLFDGRQKILYGEVWDRAMKRSRDPMKHPSAILSQPNSEEWLIDALAGWHRKTEMISISPKRPDLRKRVQKNEEGARYCLSLFTSGSMGNGTRVRFTPENLIANLRQISSVVPHDMINENDSSYSILPWSHCYGLICELLFLITRGARIYLPVSDPRQDMTRFHPTLLFTVPYMLDRVMTSLSPVSKIPSHHRMFWGTTAPMVRRAVFGKSLRAISIGGAACNPLFLRDCELKLGVPIYQGYGLTEASPMIALHTTSTDASKKDSVGRILPGIDARITEDGEVVVGGPNIVGSLPEDRYVEQRFLRTGDRGRIDEDGYLYISGRIHDHFKLSNGLYIHPGPIEQLYMSLYRPPGVSQWAIVPHPRQASRLLLVGFCSDPLRIACDLATILRIGREHLKSYEVPIDVYFIAQQNSPFLTEKYTVRRAMLSQYLSGSISNKSYPVP